MLTTEDKKWISELFADGFAEQDRRIGEKFAEQDKRIDEKFAEQDKRIDEKFAEQDRRIGEKFAERDKRIDEKFAEQDRRIDEKFAEQDRRIDEKFAEQDERIEERFSEQDKWIERQFAKQVDIMKQAMANYSQEAREEYDNRLAAQEKKFELLIENDITSRLNAFYEYLPGAYKSYARLEKRVDDLERNHNILELAVMDHLRQA